MQIESIEVRSCRFLRGAKQRDIPQLGVPVWANGNSANERFGK